MNAVDVLRVSLQDNCGLVRTRKHPTVEQRRKLRLNIAWFNFESCQRKQLIAVVQQTKNRVDVAFGCIQPQRLQQHRLPNVVAAYDEIDPT